MATRPGIFGGIFVALFSLVFFFYSLDYPYKTELGPGPGFFSIWLSGILFLLALVYIYEAWRGEDSAESMPNRQGQKNILFILGCMALFAVMLSFLGFIVSGTIFLTILFYQGYKLLTSILIGTAVSVFLYVLFSILLNVQLPTNAFGF